MARQLHRSTAPAGGGKGRKRFIAAVDRHIESIYTELATQMKRMARIQTQVDELREKIRKGLAQIFHEPDDRLDLLRRKPCAEADPTGEKRC
jgi:hypothetical protein